jgi:16S rRNA (adenine1518-N6/adenine1519-N6)-dimethyltransferase
MSQIDDLPPLRDVIETHGLMAKKSLGQNFLLDLNLTLKIAKSSGSLTGHTVLEIGPGPGGLTRALLAAGADRVVAIERDSRCIAALNEIAAHYPGRLEIIEADALAFDPKPLLAGCKTKIMANLPYNIGTELLTGWLTDLTWPPFFDSMTLMFQREVAERIVATPENRKNYGRLGVLCGWRTDAKILFNVPPSAFTPPPTIMSSIVQLMPYAQPLPCDVKILERVTAAVFGQRRKMLRQSLKPLGDVTEILSKAKIDGTQRAEELPVEAFIDLANAFQEFLNSPRT